MSNNAPMLLFIILLLLESISYNLSEAKIRNLYAFPNMPSKPLTVSSDNLSPDFPYFVSYKNVMAFFPKTISCLNHFKSL